MAGFWEAVAVWQDNRHQERMEGQRMGAGEVFVDFTGKLAESQAYALGFMDRGGLRGVMGMNLGGGSMTGLTAGLSAGGGGGPLPSVLGQQDGRVQVELGSAIVGRLLTGEVGPQEQDALRRAVASGAEFVFTNDALQLLTAALQ